MELCKFSRCIFSEDIFKHRREAKQQEALRLILLRCIRQIGTGFTGILMETVSSISRWYVPSTVQRTLYICAPFILTDTP